MASAKMLNLERVLARLRAIPPAMKAAAEQKLKVEVDALVAEQKRLAPDDPDTGGSRIRDAIRAYPNPDRPLSYRVISDAKDEKGKPIAANVEHGHRNRDGTHTRARPTFFPVYRARKLGMKRRITAAARKALRDTLSK
jgi:hypothetical protein